MNASDISRFLLQPRKHYVDAMDQQGRVATDADRNEGAALDDEDRRRILRDLIGPTGSPDQGFAADLQVGDAVIPQPIAYNGAPAVDVLPYRVHAGVLYVDGRRYVQDGPEGDIVALQPEFLQMGEDQAPLAQPGEVHSQLLYLRAGEQWVSSIEDAEFHEVALGGVDTSTRVRRMSRVELGTVENGLTCDAAWTGIRDGIETATGGTFNASGTRLQSAARLRITLVPGEALDSCAPCSPDDPGRYLGADNQTIRIMMATSDRYVFAEDNAAGIYRVRLGEAEDGLIPVEMLTLPRDAARWPLRNTVVEVMPWGALLPNGEKVADRGIFLRIAQGFDPDTSRFSLDAADQPALDALTTEWDTAHPHRPQLPNDNDPEGDYRYVRFWHRLDDDADPVLLDTAGPHTLLNRLGIEPVFDGAGIERDYWMITLRPNTPRSVVPWDLTQAGGVPPHGPQRLYAPLSLITFRPPGPGEPSNAEIVQTVADCRARFNPLVGGDGCCTHSVGDGVTSVGDYTSIQAAIDNLPAEGGKVCLLPGTFDEEVHIDRDNVWLEGCGFQSLLRSPGGEAPAPGLVLVTGSNVMLRDFSLATIAQVGVQVNEEDAGGGIASSSIRLEGLRVMADQREGEGGQTRSGIDIRRARDVTVRGCSVELDGSLTDDAAVMIRGEDALIEGCRIESLPEDGPSSAWAGLQIGGDSRRITVRRNTIRGGVGHGITLGSLFWTSETTTTTTGGFGAGSGLINPFNPCAPTLTMVQPVVVEDVRYDASSAGDLQDILIADNRIEDMSANGISVLTLLPLDEEDGQGEMITTSRITIERNRIRDCVDQSRRLHDLAPAPKIKKLDAGEAELGGRFTVSNTRDAGVFLAEGEHICLRDNDIHDNGTGGPNPIAGVSILYGDNISLEGNRIRNNGLQQSGSIPSADGTGAGIFISLAGIAANPATHDQADAFGFSLRIEDNVVDHPNGPALAARATGPVSVVGNHLFSHGSNAVAQEAGKAACVAITNLGAPAESVDLPAGEPSAERWLMPDGSPEYLQRDTDPSGAEPRIGPGGRILFARNHVTLHWVLSSDVGTGLQAGFSVSLCTQDDLACTSNQFSLNVEDPGTKKSGGTVFARQPRMSAHVVAIGATANFSRNRIAEGVNDALISHLTLGGFLASSTDNLSTHLGFVSTLRSFQANSSDPPSGDPLYRVDRNNLVWLTPTAKTSGSTLVSLATVHATANQLFSAFAANCLGVEQSGGTTFDFIQILAAFPTDG